LCWITVGLVLVQLLLGAIRRHTGTTMIPHAIGAAAVAAHVILIFRRVMISFYGSRALVRTSGLMLSLLAVQLVLGLYSWLLTESVRGRSNARPAILDSETLGSAALTSHLAIGAGILVCSVMLAAMAQRLMTDAAAPAGDTTPATGRLAAI
jgi:Zn-dependent protease